MVTIDFDLCPDRIVQCLKSSNFTRTEKSYLEDAWYKKKLAESPQRSLSDVIYELNKLVHR
jgi:hypothetical protein